LKKTQTGPPEKNNPVSRRRKFLGWTGIISYILFIYLTLPYAPAFQRVLLRWWGDPAKKIGIVLTVLLGGTAFLFFLVRQKGYRFRIVISGLVLAGLYFLAFKYLVLFPAEQFHFAEYGVLSWMVYLILIREHSLKKTISLVLLLGLAAGVIDEIIQHFLPQRHFEWRDILLNAVSSVLGLAWVIAMAGGKGKSQTGSFKRSGLDRKPGD